MKEIGKVLENKNKFSIVEVGGSYCESCISKEKCLFHREREKLVEAENKINAKPGDIVLLEVPPKKYVFITFVIYLIPIISMFVGSILGEYIFKNIYFKGENITPILSGFIFLVFSILLIRVFNKFLLLRPKIEEVINEDFLKNLTDENS
ncbi:MAG: SoxR reducing system RseC family protein [Caldisericia bacterium]|nr:SoxR reducing system RseC family protein [Caldisericia bacterium]